jgi:hypothetical protein
LLAKLPIDRCTHIGVEYTGSNNKDIGVSVLHAPVNRRSSIFWAAFPAFRGDFPVTSLFHLRLWFHQIPGNRLKVGRLPPKELVDESEYFPAFFPVSLGGTFAVKKPGPP